MPAGRKGADSRRSSKPARKPAGKAAGKSATAKAAAGTGRRAKAGKAAEAQAGAAGAGNGAAAAFGAAEHISPPGASKFSEGWQQLLSQLAGRPEVMAQALREQMDAHNRLLEELAGMGDPASADQSAARPAGGDRRFADPRWESHPFYRYLRGSYEAFSGSLRALPDKVDLDPTQRQAVELIIDQVAGMMAPSNYAATNPQVMEATVASGGKNLQDGLANYISDLQAGMITQTDRDAFAVGENLAVTPGKVVLRSHLFELIEYAPTTAKVAAEPLLVVPPCINKYYILDLQPHNSFIRHLVERGLRVFLISWVNPGADHAHLDWNDYVEDGVIAAIDAVAGAAGGRQVHALGYCISGTLLACAASILRSRRRKTLASMSMLTAFLDFCDTGKIGLFIDDAAVAKVEGDYQQGGVHPGLDLARTFAFVRPDDLIWPYVVNNYLLGKKPKAFDILHWNSDMTNLPGPMYAWYLRHAYLANDLKDGGVKVCGHELDFAKIDLPGVAVACESDHIVPWPAAWQSARLLGDQVEFVLASSGHVAGVVNPPSRNKGHHFVGANAASAEQWQAGAEKRPGSWWDTFADWLIAHSSRQVAAAKSCGGGKLRPIADAPGIYVRTPLPAAEAGSQ
ncbi:MAG: class I poly(R)-hydroxyalkanoic acid synthase [Betaproteobacteria bacterium]|nr:class I poly(R)-hydroxyalkanoic acid synthase [Betaproteobacteria bacterium]